MQYQLGALATCTAIFVYVFLRRYRKPSAIRDVPGPANPSWIFGTSPAFHLLLQPITLNVKNPKDTNGISCPKKLVGQRRGSSRISGTSFVGTVPLGCVLPLSTDRVSRFLTPAGMIDVCAQEDRLWIADPKAANHIIQKSGYLYAKPSENQEISALFNDFGLPSVEGELSATNRSFSFLIV